MTDTIRPAATLVVLLSLAVFSVAFGSTTPAPSPWEPLAFVGGDTVTTEQLQLELNVMLKTVGGNAAVSKPAPDAVLTRLVQNALLIQEGYRMGIHERFSVANQVRDVVREKSMVALLDSVAGTAPADAADPVQARRDAVDAFVAGLKRTYDVQVDSTLLASLDYGSEDPDVYQRLRESDEVLATLPGRVLRVRGLTQTIRWEEFHGLAGRPDAAEVRDRIFRTWLAETMLMHEAHARGFDRKPQVLRAAKAVERALVHEETFGVLVDLDYEPSDEEIAGYYAAHVEDFRPAPRIKLESVLLKGEEPARLFCARLRQGAKLSWLAKRTPEVVEGPPPFPAEWHAPEKLGVDPADAKVGFVPEPYEIMGGGWVAAVVADVETTAPMPLEECRREVAAKLKGEHLRDSVIDVVARLEAAAEIEILPGAEATVARHLDAAYASIARDGEPAASPKEAAP